MKNFNIKIIVAGEGGQGGQTVAKILAYTAFLDGMYSLYVPNFGVEQRGGVSIAFLQISDTPIPYPKFAKADVLVVLSDRAIKRVENYVDQHTKIIFNNTLIKATGCRACEEIGIDATTLAIRDFNYQVLNMIILGSLAAALEKWSNLSFEKLENAIKKQLSHKYKKRPQLEKLNMDAFKKGKNLVSP